MLPRVKFGNDLMAPHDPHNLPRWALGGGQSVQDRSVLLNQPKGGREKLVFLSPTQKNAVDSVCDQTHEPQRC